MTFEEKVTLFVIGLLIVSVLYLFAHPQIIDAVFAALGG